VRTPEALNLDWLLKLRWGAAVGQVLLFVLAALVLSLDVAWVPVLGLIALEVGSNLAATAWARRQPTAARALLRGLLVLDVTLFTTLLLLSGGPNNPFSFLSLVYIALAAVVLDGPWAWGLAGLALLGFGALFALTSGAPHVHMMGWHLRGMWVAFGVAAAFIVYFVQRVTRALGARERQLAEATARMERQQRLASLATLAAGAAHELATPLSTIAVAARELERGLAGSAHLADATLIREQVQRCRDILQQMAAESGASVGEVPVPIALPAWVSSATAGLSGSERLQVAVPEGVSVVGPPRALAHALRGVLKNALQAGAGVVQVQLEGDTVRVRDAGQGMSQETLARAGEPFFTTKPPGDGTGLGLFLTRAVLEQLGGRLELESRLGTGTTASLTLPRSAFVGRR
jgi:two-component system sensor histidine kinase RegB